MMAPASGQGSRAGLCAGETRQKMVKIKQTAPNCILNAVDARDARLGAV
jgi:hypothetical protein